MLERLHSWAIGVAGLMGAAALTTLVVHRWRAWTALGIVCLMAGLLVAFLWRAWLKKPQLRIGSPFVQDQMLNVGNDLAIPVREAYLHISNEPRHGGLPVDRVYVTLRCIRESDKVEIWENVYARWSYSSKDTREEETQTASFRSLFPSDPPERIDIALKINDKDECYILSPRTKYEGLRKPLDPMMCS